MLKMGTRLAVVCVLAATVFATEAGAQAEEPSPELPFRYVERPITLRKRTLRVDVAPPDFGLFDSGALLGPVGPLGAYGIRFGQDVESGDRGMGSFTAATGFGGLGIGAGYGITDGVEVGTLLLPMRFDGNQVFGNLAIYGRARLVDGKTQIGLQLTVSTPTREDLGLGLGLPINVRVGTNGRLETGVELETLIDTDGDGITTFNVDAPFAITGALGQRGFLGARTGVTYAGIGHANLVAVPVGAQGGFTVHAGPALMDIKASFQWFFLTDDDPDVLSMQWNAMLGANLHFGL